MKTLTSLIMVQQNYFSEVLNLIIYGDIQSFVWFLRFQPSGFKMSMIAQKRPNSTGDKKMSIALPSNLLRNATQKFKQYNKTSYVRKRQIPRKNGKFDKFFLITHLWPYGRFMAGKSKKMCTKMRSGLNKKT